MKRQRQPLARRSTMVIAFVVGAQGLNLLALAGYDRTLAIWLAGAEVLFVITSASAYLNGRSDAREEGGTGDPPGSGQERL